MAISSEPASHSFSDTCTPIIGSTKLSQASLYLCFYSYLHSLICVVFSLVNVLPLLVVPSFSGLFIFVFILVFDIYVVFSLIHLQKDRNNHIQEN